MKFLLRREWSGRSVLTNGRRPAVLGSLDVWHFSSPLILFITVVQVKCILKILLMNILFEEYVSSFREFQIHLFIPACVISCEFMGEVLMKFLLAQFS